jgi:hypothetical protein
MTRTSLLSIAAAAALAVQPLLAGVAAANQIGVTAAVQPDATGTPPNRGVRVLQIGVDMFANERVETGPEGKTQLVFLDGTALSIGPNSDLTLDEFVYDPAARTGSLVMSSTKGVFRLVGGAISKKTPITIRAPNATIGIRGGIALVSIEPGGQVDASFLFGIGLTVTTPNGQQTVDRPGSAVMVRPGKPIQVAMAGSPQLGRTLGKLEGSRTRQAPTATPKVQDSDIAKSQIGSLASRQAPNSRLAVQPKGGPQRGRPGFTAGGGPGAGPGPGGLPLPGLLDPLGNLLDRPPPLFETTSALSDSTLTSTSTAGGPVPRGGLFVSGDPVTGEADGLTPDGVFDPARYRPFANALFDGGIFAGAAAGDPIRLPLQPGSFSFAATAAGGTLSPIGPVGGSAFVAPDLSFAYYALVNGGGERAAVFAGVPSVGQGAPLQAFTLIPGFPDTGGIPFLLDGFGGDIPVGATRPLFWIFNPSEGAFAGPSTRSVWGTVAISGNGPTQRSAIVGALAKAFFDPALGKDVFGGVAQGFARDGGSGAAIDSRSGNSVVPDGTGVWSFGAKGIGTEYFVTGSDRYAGTSRVPSQVSANLFNQPGAARGYQQQVAGATPVPAGIGQQRSARTLHGFAAALADERDPLSPSTPVAPLTLTNTNASASALTLVTDPATNRAFMSMDLSGNQGQVELFFGDPTAGGASDRSAFVDDQVFALREAAGGGRLQGSIAANVDAVALSNYFWADRAAVPSGVALCACGFMTWGFWAADIVPANPSSGAHAFRTTLAGFVAGELPAAGDIPATGTATYAGHAMADVKNPAGAQYVAFGNFQQTWDFGQRIGTATISGLDGATYEAIVGSGNGRDLIGSLSGVSAGATGRSGGYAAAFFRNGADAAGGIGGAFTLSGGDGYQAAGVVVGQR